MTLIAHDAEGAERLLPPRGQPQGAALSLEAHIVDPLTWDRTVATFDGACQEQLHTFARARWPKVRHEPVVFEQAGRVVGGTLVMIQPIPLGLGAIAVVKWGPMLADEQAPDAAETYAAMVDALVADYAVGRRMMLSVLPRAAVDARNIEYEHLLGRGFKEGAKLLFPNRYIVNLRLDDEAQRRSFDQKWRYHLGRAEKAGLSFEHADAARLPEFHALYEAMSDRKKFPDYSAYGTVEALMAMPWDSLRPELFFVRHDGEVVAGALIFKAGDRAVYLYGATNADALPLRAGYFMHWHIIRWLRDNTPARWYDLGGTDGFQGLHQFKKGMVGARGVISAVPPVANIATHWKAALLGNAAFVSREAYHGVRRILDRMRKDRAKPDQARPRETE